MESAQEGVTHLPTSWCYWSMVDETSLLSSLLDPPSTSLPYSSFIFLLVLLLSFYPPFSSQRPGSSMDHFSIHSSGDERVPVYQLRPRFHTVTRCHWRSGDALSVPSTVRKLECTVSQEAPGSWLIINQSGDSFQGQ